MTNTLRNVLMDMTPCVIIIDVMNNKISYVLNLEITKSKFILFVTNGVQVLFKVYKYVNFTKYGFCAIVHRFHISCIFVREIANLNNYSI